MNEEITVKVTYGGFTETFIGHPDEVWAGLNRFLAQHFPGIALLSKVTLTVDVKELLEKLQDVIRLTRKGDVYLAVDRKFLTDREIVMLFLIGSYLTHKLGYREEDQVSLGEICLVVGKPRKLVSTRLSELCSRRWVTKVKGKRFSATVNGIQQFLNTILPKIQKRIPRTV